MDQLVAATNSLADRYRMAWSRIEVAKMEVAEAREKWVDATFELGAVILDARVDHQSDQDYSRWIAANGLCDLHPNERRALTEFARKPNYWRPILISGERTSWRYIFEHAPKVRSTTNDKPNLSRRSGFSKETKAKRRKQARREAALRQSHGEVIPEIAASSKPLGLTPEEVDPVLAKDRQAFLAAYGHINLETKAQREESRAKQALADLMEAISKTADAARLFEPFFVTGVVPQAFPAWSAKPGKREKFGQWRDRIKAAADFMDVLATAI